MKLKPCTEFPPDKTHVLALNHKGYVGVAYFYDGHWYSMPAEIKMEEPDFQWIQLSSHRN